MSEKRAVNSTELDDETEQQTLLSCLHVYDVKKLDDDVGCMSTSVSLISLFVILATLSHLCHVVGIYTFTKMCDHSCCPCIQWVKSSFAKSRG